MTAPDKPTPTFRRMVRLFVADMLILVVLFVAAEAGFRMVAPQSLHRTVRGVYELTDGELRYRAGSKTICSHGYGDHEFAINSWRARDREYGPKQPGEWRILSIGDSYSDNIAMDVEQIYANVLETKLAAEYPNRTVSVINAGQVGWSLWDYRQYLAEMVDLIEPDVVVIAVGVLSDGVESVEEPTDRPKMVLIDGLPTLAEASLRSRIKWGVWYANEWMECNSHAYVALRKATSLPSYWLGIDQTTPRYHRICLEEKAGERVREPTAAVLRKVKGLCDARGVALAILRVTQSYECDPGTQAWKIQLENPDLSKLDMTRPARLMSRIAQDAGIPLCDPSDDLAAATEPTYYPIWLHWNELGNQIVADCLMRFLDREQLLGPSSPSDSTVR